jgi:hypothetical protein
MAGIKIHQYPLERTSIGDDDYYDIDYWTGSSYQSAKIKGSTLKNVLGANYIDITTYISGYELTDKDAGKLITNSNANVRTLVIPSGLALPNNMITVKGRIGIQPETGVNITLPDGSTITEPTQFTCEADEVYILHKSSFSGDNYILVSVKKSENIGTNDLIISDAVRELQVATDGTFQIVTNDANNSAIFKVGENSNERFSGVELNSVTFEQTIAEPNPTNNGAGVLVDINPNEFGIEGRLDIGDSGTKRNRLYFSPNEVIFEKSNAGKLTFNSSGAVNTFEDLRATKKGIEYSADYSANFSVRSLVDKAYVDNEVSTKIGAVIQDTTPQLGGNLDLNGNDINGTGNVDVTGNVIADVVQLRGGTGTQGEISWSADEETIKVIMDGTTLYMGQDTFVHVRNNTASIITKGTAVYATGTLGASGRITVAPMIANGTIAGRLFIGLTAEDIAIGADGQVCSYGKIRQINTNAYNDGDVLWISPTVAGQLTATEPTAPNLKIATAFVIHAANNGTLMVRAEQGTDLHSDQRVQVSGLTNNDVLTWNNTNQRWQNAQPEGGGHEIYNGTDVTPLPERAGLRFKGYLEAVDDAGDDETVVDLSSTAITPAETTRFAENGSGNVDLKIQENKLPTGDANGFAIEYTASAECIIGLDTNSEIKEFEVIEIYNILKEDAVTGNKQLALLDINGTSANIKAKFEISAIAVQNTTANVVTLNIGSTALGTDVVNAFALGASETKKLPLGTTFFSITTGQNLFISSASWNSASINIHVTISKIWQ